MLNQGEGILDKPKLVGKSKKIDFGGNVNQKSVSIDDCDDSFIDILQDNRMSIKT